MFYRSTHLCNIRVSVSGRLHFPHFRLSSKLFMGQPCELSLLGKCYYSLISSYVPTSLPSQKGSNHSYSSLSHIYKHTHTHKMREGPFFVLYLFSTYLSLKELFFNPLCESLRFFVLCQWNNTPFRPLFLNFRVSVNRWRFYYNAGPKSIHLGGA